MAERNKKPLMATRKSTSTKSDSGLSATLLGGSEELFDFFCQSCNKDNVHLEAAGYCQHCREYLCDTCCKYHRKTTATQHHKLLDKSDMPKINIVVKPTDELEETCPKHQNKMIEYFCNGHGELCCIVCVNNDHGSCKVISHIPDVSDGIANSNEYKHMMTGLKALIFKVTNQQSILELSTKNNDNYQSESLAGIRGLLSEAYKLPDKYEENAVMKVSQLHHENSERIKSVSLECQGIISYLTAKIADLDAKAKGGKNNQLFVDLKTSKQQLAAMEAKANDVTDCRITRYGFHREERVEDIMSTLSIRQDDEETKARYTGEVNVKLDDDTEDCSIYDIAVLPGGDIVITDVKNKSLKLVDMKLNKITSRISLSSMPYGVTNTEPNQVGVSLGIEGKIEIYTVTDVLSRSDTIHVGETGFVGICFTKDRFILTYYNGGRVNIVDRSGRVLNSISADENGDRLFTYPSFITVKSDSDVAYVTDMLAHTVTIMTLGGHIISVYKNEMLKQPQGVTFGPDNSIYVCSAGKNTVLKLSATGEFQQILLDEERGLSGFPRSIAYDDTRGQLYIGSDCEMPDEHNCVKFFQIK